MINTNFAYNINKVICTFPKILQKRKKTSAYIWPNQYLFVPLWPNNDIFEQVSEGFDYGGPFPFLMTTDILPTQLF